VLFMLSLAAIASDAADMKCFIPTLTIRRASQLTTRARIEVSVEVPRAIDAGSDDRGVRLPPLQFEADEVLPDLTRRHANVQTRTTATAIEEGHFSWAILVEIPIEPSERDRNIERYLDEIGALADPAQHEFLTARRPQAAEALRRIYIENRPGNYVFRVRYRSTQPACEMTSADVRLHVEPTGSFIDELRSHSSRK
jgi:hypothetical protein